MRLWLDGALHATWWGIEEQGVWCHLYLTTDGAQSICRAVQAFGCPESVEEIVCGIGPGSYTGMRVATSFAMGLARATNRPFRTFPSLAAWAVDGATPVCADARAGGIYRWCAGEVIKVAKMEEAGSCCYADTRLVALGLLPVFAPPLPLLTPWISTAQELCYLQPVAAKGASCG